ncbi:transposase [Corynebacterium phocae]
MAKEGNSTAEICRELNVSEATLSRWPRECGTMSRSW